MQKSAIYKLVRMGSIKLELKKLLLEEFVDDDERRKTIYHCYRVSK